MLFISVMVKTAGLWQLNFGQLQIY